MKRFFSGTIAKGRLQGMTQNIKKLDLDFRDQITYMQGLHRSGWPYAMRHLMDLSTPNGVWCDTYVDRTFHWLKPATIPYTRPWVGFVHHTFDENFSDYNSANLLRNDDFLASLTTCKGIYVFSSRQKELWDAELSSRDCNVPVECLVHPTEEVTVRFQWEAFLSNPKKKLVQIGAWLRDTYSIYELNGGKGPIRLPDADFSLTKAALKGPRMDAYYRPADFFRLFRRLQWKKLPGGGPIPTTDVPTRILSVNGEIPRGALETAMDGMCGSLMCRDSDYALNKYVEGAIKLLQRLDESVVLFPTLSDKDYDDLLSKNLVYVDLWDAAAVNTLLECIVRNTPIFIKRLPAVVEILGEDYPLLFDSKEEALGKMSLAEVEKAHHHLVQLDKTLFTGEAFIDSIVRGEIYQTL